MSDMRPKNKQVVAIVASDLHLREKAPVSRAEKAEGEWLTRTASFLKQIQDLKDEHNAVVIYPGDIFDKWKSPPELINFAIKHLPKGYAIPGQHDLPLHNYKDVHKSAYWTLVEAGNIMDMRPGRVYDSDNLRLHPFPWKYEVTPLKIKSKSIINVAVVHEYIWLEGHNYPGAPTTQKVASFKKKLQGYHAAVFGDNHKGFLSHAGDCAVLNCGGFMRHKSDEKTYVPKYGLIWSDGSVTRTPYLDLENDKWVDVDFKLQSGESMEEFITLLDSFGDVSLNFAESVRRYLDDNQVSDDIRKYIIESLGE